MTNLDPRDKILNALTRAIDAGKYLDVSFVTEKGTGSKQFPIPKEGSTTKKLGVGDPDEDAVARIVSNNYDGYKRALQLIGGYDDYITAYFDAYVVPGYVSERPTRTPRRTARKTPRRTARKTPRKIKQRVVSPKGRPLTMEQLGDVISRKYAEAVGKGKVLDVSKLKHTGTGISMIVQPGSTNTQRSYSGSLRWVEGFPIVSNNYAAFKLAVDALGSDYEEWAQQFADQHGTGVYARVRSPKAQVETGPSKRFGPPVPFVGDAVRRVNAGTGEIYEVEVTRIPTRRTQTRRSPTVQTRRSPTVQTRRSPTVQTRRTTRHVHFADDEEFPLEAVTTRQSPTRVTRRAASPARQTRRSPTRQTRFEPTAGFDRTQSPPPLRPSPRAQTTRFFGSN